MRLRAGKNKVCILYNEMMSIYPRVSQMYTACHQVHLRYLCILVFITIERSKEYMPYYDVAKLVTVTKTNMINEIPCDYGTLRTTGGGIWHQVTHSACAEVSAAPEISCRACAMVTAAVEVSCRPAQRSQQFNNLTILIVNPQESGIHLHHYRCVPQHVSLL
jgi:hypothetical protein